MINLFLGVYQPNVTVIEVGGVKEMPPIQRIQDYPLLELKLHTSEAIAGRQGFSSDLDVESRYWWEPHFTEFEEKLPLALRYTYQHFDIAVAI